MATGDGTKWFQKEINVGARKRGCHLITDEIDKLSEIKKIKIGLCHVLSNENCLFRKMLSDNSRFYVIYCFPTWYGRDLVRISANIKVAIRKC